MDIRKLQTKIEEKMEDMFIFILTAIAMVVAVNIVNLTKRLEVLKIANTVIAGGKLGMILHNEADLHYIERISGLIKEKGWNTIHQYPCAIIVHITKDKSLTTWRARKNLIATDLGINFKSASLRDAGLIMEAISELKVKESKWSKLDNAIKRIKTSYNDFMSTVLSLGKAIAPAN